MAVLGTINLPLILGDKKYKRELYVKSVVIDISLAYNAILDRPVLTCHDIVINMGVISLKLPTPGELAVIQGNQKSAQECYRHSTKSLRKVTLPIDLLEKPNSH